MTYVAVLGFNLLFSGRFHSAFPVCTSFAPSLYIHLLMHIIWMFCWLQLNMSINWNQYIIPLLKPVSLVFLTSVMIIPSRLISLFFLSYQTHSIIMSCRLYLPNSTLIPVIVAPVQEFLIPGFLAHLLSVLFKFSPQTRVIPLKCKHLKVSPCFQKKTQGLS